MSDKPLYSRIFNINRDDPDPNKAENVPYYTSIEKLRNHAYAEWFQNHGGDAALESLTRGIIGKIISAITHKRDTEINRNRNLALLDEITRDMFFITFIEACFEKDSKLKSQPMEEKA